MSVDTSGGFGALPVPIRLPAYLGPLSRFAVLCPAVWYWVTLLPQEQNLIVQFRPALLIKLLTALHFSM